MFSVYLGYLATMSMLKNLYCLYESIYSSICISKEPYICMLSSTQFLLLRKFLHYIILCWKDNATLYNEVFNSICLSLSSRSSSSVILLCLRIIWCKRKSRTRPFESIYYFVQLEKKCILASSEHFREFSVWFSNERQLIYQAFMHGCAVFMNGWRQCRLLKRKVNYKLRRSEKLRHTPLTPAHLGHLSVDFSLVLH